MKKEFLSFVFFSFFSPLFAAENPNVEVLEAFVRLTPANAPNSAAFMVLKNKTAHHLSVVAAENPASATTELHGHQNENGVMKMMKLEKITLPPQSETVLKPGGLHLMLFDLKKNLEEGERIPFTLIFDDHSTLGFQAVVKKQ